MASRRNAAKAAKATSAGPHDHLGTWRPPGGCDHDECELLEVKVELWRAGHLFANGDAARRGATGHERRRTADAA